MKIDEIMKNRKAVLAISLISALAILGCGFNSVTASETGIQEASIVGLVVGALVGVVVAVALLPTIANQTGTLESNADLSTAEQGLVGLWPLLIIMGVMMAIIGMAL